ncbi:hypothetical protein D0859_10151 [Hortaea werneckii]|uniref:TauD/TfdA-like domain-containing protein n=1 Tax=Hortaea werneckii TaxID=91943 RepID=A0A3M7IK70_HORWE|nr:hypothetical protein D0859_10151 [Hortaea werneckii]
MPHLLEPLAIRPLDDELRKKTLLGAEVILPSSIRHLDVSQLSTEEHDTLREALFKNGVLVLFDPAPLDIHSGGAKQVTDPKNILSQNGCTRVPSAPQVTVIGQGKYYDHEGISEIDLKHLSYMRWKYRKYQTRSSRSPMIGKWTSLRERLRLAVFSGARNFELLSADEQDFATRTTVHYAPRAYEWIKDCKATADGLSIAKRGREKTEDELPDFEWDKVHEFPMVWKNPTTGRPHLQILGCCVRALRTKDQKTGVVATIDDLDEVRSICHRFQSRVYTPENVYAHRWQKGDLVIFHNRGVMHSITGQLARHPERRLLWQCNMASLAEPEAYRK